MYSWKHCNMLVCTSFFLFLPLPSLFAKNNLSNLMTVKYLIPSFFPLVFFYSQNKNKLIIILQMIGEKANESCLEMLAHIHMP